MPPLRIYLVSPPAKTPRRLPKSEVQESILEQAKAEGAEEMSEKRTVRGGAYFRPGKKGGSWWIDYYNETTRVREKTNALNKTEALRMRRERLNEIDRGERGIPGSPSVVLLHTLAEEYLSFAMLHKRSARSDEVYIRRIKEHFKDVPVHKISRADCLEFKNTLTAEWQKRAWAKAGTGGKKPEVRLATVDRYVGCLKRLFNWAIEIEKLETNPAARVRLHRQDQKPFHLLSEEEEERLLHEAGEGKATHLRPIIVLALATAMRKGEILGLTWDQVDLDRRMITLAGAVTKNKRVKHVPINADAEAVLTERLKSRPKDGIYVFPGREGKKMLNIKTAWRCAQARAGIPLRCRFHDLRRTAVSRMVMRGVDPVTIGRLAGWTDSSAPVMLRRYAHLTGDHLHQAAKALERGNRSHYIGTNSETSARGKGMKSSITT